MYHVLAFMAKKIGKYIYYKRILSFHNVSIMNATQHYVVSSYILMERLIGSICVLRVELKNYSTSVFLIDENEGGK